VATERNRYLDEWEYSLKKLGYSYAILGMGMEWKGFNTRMELYMKECKENPNELIVTTDSYDLLFVGSPKELEEKYNKNGSKIVIGTDPYCEINCDNISEKQCGFSDTQNSQLGLSERNYINAGFIMGRGRDLYHGFKYALEHGEEDDQIGWSRYIARNCGKVGLDTTGEFVLNYYTHTLFMPHLWFKSLPNLVVKNNRLYNEENKNYPVVVHIPYQSGDWGVRSEFVRNFVNPGRENIPQSQYAYEMVGHVYKNMCYPVYAVFVRNVIDSIIVLVLIIIFILYK